MAELLIHVKTVNAPEGCAHWMDNFTQSKIDSLSDVDKRSRNARSQLGDIVVVKPDGWVWGREECLPNYLVVKLPQLTVEQVEHFTQSLQTDVVVARVRNILAEEWEDAEERVKIEKEFVSPPTATYNGDGTYTITGMVQEKRMLKKHKYQIPSQWVQPYITAGTSVIEVKLSNQQQNFINNVVEKTS